MIRRRANTPRRRKLQESIQIVRDLTVEDYRNEAWGGADYVLGYLTDDEVEQIFAMLTDSDTEPMDLTQLNDFFRFDENTIADWLGYSSWGELEKSRK